jgi:hypothetical protein
MIKTCLILLPPLYYQHEEVIEMSLTHNLRKGKVLRDEDPFRIAADDNAKLMGSRLFRVIPLLAVVIPPSDLLPVIKYINKRRIEGRKIDARTAKVGWWYREMEDPYNVFPASYVDSEYFLRYEQMIGREYFAQRPGSKIWLWIGDIPRPTARALQKSGKLATATEAGFSKRKLKKIWQDEHDIR